MSRGPRLTNCWKLASRKTLSYLNDSIAERITVHGMVGESGRDARCSAPIYTSPLREVWDKALGGRD